MMTIVQEEATTMTQPGPARPAARRRGRLRALLGAAALLAGATGAPAHDFYLIPGAAAPEAGAPFDVAMHVSDVFPGDPVPWRAERTRAFFVELAGKRLDLIESALEGEPPRARVTLRSPGTAVLALSTLPSYIELDAEAFEGYLKHEGHDDLIRSRREAGTSADKGRERYTRHVKAIIDVGGRRTDAALARLGMTLEIVPEAHPTAARPGGSLPVRVLHEGRPYAGGLLCATHAGHSKEHDAYAWCGRVDAAGRAAVPIRAAGWQIVRITRMTPISGDPKADWHSDWAALTFAVAGGPPAAPGGAAMRPGSGEGRR